MKRGLKIPEMQEENEQKVTKEPGRQAASGDVPALSCIF